jgi:hypothetical protein
LYFIRCISLNLNYIKNISNTILNLTYLYILPQASFWFEETFLESLVKSPFELHAKQMLKLTGKTRN